MIPQQAVTTPAVARPEPAPRAARGARLAGLAIGLLLDVAVLTIAWYLVTDVTAGNDWWAGDAIVVAVPVAAVVIAWPVAYLIARMHGVARPGAVVSWGLAISVVATAVLVVAAGALAFVLVALSAVFMMSGGLFEPIGVLALVVSCVGALLISLLALTSMRRAFAPRAAVQSLGAPPAPPPPLESPAAQPFGAQPAPPPPAQAPSAPAPPPGIRI